MIKTSLLAAVGSLLAAAGMVLAEESLPLAPAPVGGTTPVESAVDENQVLRARIIELERQLSEAKHLVAAPADANPENKPAAAGMLATRDILSQPKDGYNLLLCTHFEAINTAIYKNVGFKLSEIAPISLVAKYYYGLALSPSVPAKDFASFVDYAKARPGNHQRRRNLARRAQCTGHFLLRGYGLNHVTIRKADIGGVAAGFGLDVQIGPVAWPGKHRGSTADHVMLI